MNKSVTIMGWLELLELCETVQDWGTEDSKEMMDRLMCGLKGNRETRFRVTIEEVEESE